jgi:hypothetical protein
MDELEISGKRYISSKRIARENKYHSDYIGQLIRAGKIVGTKVGRAWYVDEESFAAYLSQENKTYVPPSVTPAAIPSSVVVVPTEAPVVAEVAAEHVTETPAEKILINQEKNFAAHEPRTVEIKKTNLTYVPDSSPLFPEIAKRSNAVDSSHIARITLQQEVVPIVEHAPAPQKARTRGSKALSVIKGTSLVVVGVGVLGLVFFVSLGINSTVFVAKGKPASVGYSQEKTFCFISGNCQSTPSNTK